MLFFFFFFVWISIIFSINYPYINRYVNCRSELSSDTLRWICKSFSIIDSWTSFPSPDNSSWEHSPSFDGTLDIFTDREWDQRENKRERNSDEVGGRGGVKWGKWREKKKKKTRETFTWVAEKNKGALHSIANLYIGDILVYSYFLVYIDLRWSTGTNYIVHVVILFIYLFFISFIYSWQTSSFQFLFILG